MSVHANINGVIYELSGVVSAAPLPPPPSVPARNDTEVTSVMSGPSGGGYVASATSEYTESGVTGAAWKAFNGVSSSGWANGWSSTAKASTAAPQCLQLDIPEAKPVYSYKLTIRSDANTLSPVAWVFEGWDGSAWQMLHSVSGAAWTAGETKTYDTSAQGVYSRYRWRFTDSGALCQVAEAKMFS